MIVDLTVPQLQFNQVCENYGYVHENYIRHCTALIVITHNCRDI